MGKGRYVKKIIFIFCILAFVSMTTFPVYAQYWVAMPPYNVLWPLWSPPLVTDFNWDPLVLLGTTPIITSLTKNTILPVQPGLAWDPCAPEPYAIFNAPLGYDMNLGYGGGGYIGYYYPYFVYSDISYEYISGGKYTGGLLYFDSGTNSLNPWPPPYLLDPITGAPKPIHLPEGFAGLTGLDPWLLEVLLTNADQAYLNDFEYLPTSISSISTNKCLSTDSISVTINGENFVQGSNVILQYGGFGGLGYIVDSRGTPGTARDVYLSGDYAFVTCGQEGLQVISRNSENLSILSSCDTPDFAQGIFICGEYAFVADGESGLQVISLNSLTDPAIVAFYNTPAYAADVYVRDSYAFVSDGESGLQVIDISDPSNPALVSSCDTSGDAWGVNVNAEYAYVADGSSGLQVIDISDPTGPSISGSCDTPGCAYDVYVRGSYAYIADGDSGLQVINITNPTNMTIVGSCYTEDEAIALYIEPPYPVYGFEYAYVACNESGMQIINITDPSNPVAESIWDTPGVAYGVQIEGKYAYVADADSLRLIQLPMLLENINIQDSTTITASIPAGYRPGAYDLQVLSPGGGTSVQKNAFTVSSEYYFKEDVKQFGTENDDRSTGIAFDPQKKHLYVVGTIERDAPPNQYDILLAKFGIDGRQKWVREIDSGVTSAGNDHGECVLVDSAGNVYVVGYTTGTENQGVLFSKRSPSDGSEIWTKYHRTSTSSFDYAMDAVLVLNVTATSIIAVGYTTNAPNGGDLDCFAMKVNSETGNLEDSFGDQGIALLGTSGEDRIEAAVGDGTSLYMVGRTKGPSEEYDAYIVKIDTQNGNALPFANDIFGTEGYFDTFMDVCAAEGKIYCSGWTSGQLIDDPAINVGVADPILVKFSTFGIVEEILQFPYYAHNYGRGILNMGLYGPLSGIIFLGDTQWPLPGSEPAGGYDAFISQFGPGVGLTTWDYSYGTDSYDIAIAAVYDSGAIYVAGHTTGAFTDFSQSSAGGTDIYLAKILLPGDNTRQGQNVVVQFLPDIKLTFEQIDTSGFTRWSQISYPPFPFTPPSGFELLSDLFIAETSSAFSGAITLDIEYNGIEETPLITISKEDEQFLRLMNYQTQSEGRWMNITKNLDTVNNFISGETYQLGYFGLMVVRSPSSALNWLLEVIESMNLKQGIENSLDVKLRKAQDALNSLNEDQRQDALYKLYAFKTETEAQSGNQLTTEQADIIIKNLEPICAYIEAQQ